MYFSFPSPPGDVVLEENSRKDSLSILIIKKKSGHLHENFNHCPKFELAHFIESNFL